MKRVDPEALYRFIRDRWGSTANIVCPEVAEPEQARYDYHADWTRHPDPSGNNDVHWTCKYCDHWTDYRPKARHNCHEQPTPTEPVIDEAVYREAARVALGAEIGHWSNGWRTAITAAIRKYEELRGVRLVGQTDQVQDLHRAAV